ncbi:pyridoxal-phosphate dependent enzyme [Dactylosporangium sp. NPDC050588]|uniref:pyridoxal-phosphate dependent enzyme n=1 Tax=Dactylosporangium sp. NPDC050588 TaxID=3157211 RepID=UPI0033CA8442
MIVASALDLVFGDLFFDLGSVTCARTLLKLEGYHASGSIKLKTASSMITALEARGELVRGRSTVVESSSGNLGVALALVCRVRGYGSVCVSDPNISAANSAAITAYGGVVEIVSRRDDNGGYLGTRIKRIRELLAEYPDYVWPNQYADASNPAAHQLTTAQEIMRCVPDVTHIYAGTGTTGTIMGISMGLSAMRERLQIVAVEPIGSVTFGGCPAKRHIPGIGTSQVPPIADRDRVDRVQYVSEGDSVAACRWLVSEYGLLLGGSTGAVVAAIRADSSRFGPSDVVVGISADNGERYLDTVYNDDWVERHIGASPDDSPTPRVRR